MKNDYSTDRAAAPLGSPAPPRGGSDAPQPRDVWRARIVWFIVALACALLTARFGVWQLSRAHQKLANAALIAERGSQPPLPAVALARDAASGEAQWQRHIVLQGRWDPAHTIYLMNRTMDERSGFLVTTPLRLPTGDAVVVQRGWVPRDDADPMKVPLLATPAGEVQVAGRVAPWPSHWIDIGHGAGGPVRQNIERAPFAAESGISLRPVTIIETATAENAGDGLRRDWSVPDLGVATNYGYAVQWFAMSVAFLGLYVWLQFFRQRPTPSSDDPGDDSSSS
jgi:surfeit locus 1 family protein